jgi:hypothetical protein
VSEERFLSDCVAGCDPSTFGSVVTGHVITRELTNALSSFGVVSVSTSEPIASCSEATNHPPCRVRLTTSLLPGRSLEEIKTAVEDTFSSELALTCNSWLESAIRLREPPSSSPHDESVLIVEIDLVELITRALNLAHWTEILALVHPDSLEPAVHVGAREFVQHLSVWTNESFDEDRFRRTMFHVFGVILRDLVCVEDYFCEQRRKKSRLFVLTYACNIFPFSDVSCKFFHLKILPRYLATLDVVVR